MIAGLLPFFIWYSSVGASSLTETEVVVTAEVEGAQYDISECVGSKEFDSQCPGDGFVIFEYNFPEGVGYIKVCKDDLTGVRVRVSEGRGSFDTNSLFKAHTPEGLLSATCCVGEESACQSEMNMFSKQWKMS